MSQDTVATAPDSWYRRRRTILIGAIALALLVAISLVAVSCLSTPTTPPPTVRVDRGQVSLAVSASGNIAPSGQQQLGFADGGTVAELLVDVGDRVEAGQLLARIDDTVAQQTLAQRRATLDGQLATLAKLRGGVSVTTARTTLDQARITEAATRRQVDVTAAANRSATDQARRQVRFDQTALNRAEAALRADRDACESSPRAAAATPAPTTGGATTGGATTGGATTGGATTGGTTPPTTTPPTTTGGTTTGGTTGGTTGATGGTTGATGGTTGATTGGATTGATTGGTTTGSTTTGGTTTGSTTGGTTAGSTGGTTTGSTTAGSTGATTGGTSSRSRAVAPTETDESDREDRSSDRRTAERRSGDGGTTEPAWAPAPVVTAPALRLVSSSGDLDDDVELGDERTGASCARLASDRSAVTQAQGAVVASRSSLDAAQERERTDAAAGQVSIENARVSVVNAENQLLTANNDSPRDIRAQEAQVADARAAVEIARQDVEETVIRAPVAGTVTAINGTTGEVVAPPAAVTSLAPGGSAPLPATTGGTGTGTSGGGAGAGAFLVLDAADPFQVVVPFEEADAARVAPGQEVDVAVDALPNDPLTGRVTSVAPAGVDLSGIVSYYAVVVVQGGAERLRSGQTAEANVRVESVNNVLRVPAAAVRRVDGRPTVTVTGPDGTPTSQPFEAGLVGDDYVEVRSGLADGAPVELPQATVTAAPAPGGPPPGN